MKKPSREKANICERITVNKNDIKIENQKLCVIPLCFVGNNLKNKYKKMKVIKIYRIELTEKLKIE